jgi:hypothetical protein
MASFFVYSSGGGACKAKVDLSDAVFPANCSALLVMLL